MPAAFSATVMTGEPAFPLAMAALALGDAERLCSRLDARPGLDRRRHARTCARRRGRAVAGRPGGVL